MASWDLLCAGGGVASTAAGSTQRSSEPCCASDNHVRLAAELGDAAKARTISAVSCA
jgi:hypothetical protein